MNTTTSTTMNTVSSTIRLSPFEQYALMYSNPIVIVRFYQIGYPLLFLLGFPGNIASLLTFSRPTLRKVSTGCLFIALGVSDMFYLLICICDVLEFGVKVPFYGRIAYNELCRFRSFMLNVTQVLSAWTLVIVSIDRWIRTRFPFKSGSICTPKNALIAVVVILLIDIGLHSHMLTSMFGMFIPTIAVAACGPNMYNVSYALFYYLEWSIIQIFTSCLVPVIIMCLVLIDIFINVRIRKRAVVQRKQAWQQDQNTKRQNMVQKQMFILMFASICIFLITNLPVAAYKIASPRRADLSASVFQILSIWTAFGWFQSINYAINFYIHCLTSTLFRKEFKQQIRFLLNKNQAVVSAMELTNTNARIQNQRTSMKY